LLFLHLNVQAVSTYLGASQETIFKAKFYDFIALYRAFHIFGQAKFPDCNSDLGSSQFSTLPQLRPKNNAQFKSGQNRPKNFFLW